MRNLVQTISNFGNFSVEDSTDIYNISSKTIFKEFIYTVQTKAEETGKSHHQECLKMRLCARSQCLEDPIKINKFSLTNKTASKINELKVKNLAMKCVCNLFSKLYISVNFAHISKQYSLLMENLPIWWVHKVWLKNASQFRPKWSNRESSNSECKNFRSNSHVKLRPMQNFPRIHRWSCFILF